MSRAILTRRSRGFTLIELLVVMAIIGILIALLMPAVQRARESARRTQCRNNLKQLALGMHNYAEAHRTFPSGWIDLGTAPFDVTFPEPLRIGQVQVNTWVYSASWGWHAFILPQIEQSTTSVNFKFDKSHADNQVAIQNVIPVYLCPSADMPNNRPNSLAYTNYRGSMGTTVDNGMLYRNSSVSFKSIPDGSSNTLLLGDTLFGFWGDAFSCCARVRDDQAYFDAYWTDDDDSDPDTPELQLFGFGSWHGDVANFALADGSARTISKTIDSNVLAHLATRNGGEQISGDF